MEVWVHYLFPCDAVGAKIRSMRASTQPDGRVIWVRSGLRIACDHSATLENAVHATGDRGAVTCPRCRDSADFQSGVIAQAASQPMQPGCANCPE